MKLTSAACRYILGTMFTVFGANGFLHFIQQPPPASAFAMQFMTATFGSHFMVVVFLVQLLSGILLLVDCFAAFALLMLAAVLTNILNFHITMDPGGIAPGLVATVLWIGAALNYRGNFRGLFAAKAELDSVELATRLK
jgi:putative oxidoreductase